MVDAMKVPTFFFSQELLLSLGAKLGDWLLLGAGEPSWVRLVDHKEVVALSPPAWQRKAVHGWHMSVMFVFDSGSSVGLRALSALMILPGAAFDSPSCWITGVVRSHSWTH